jgi:hypothetical protein
MSATPAQKKNAYAMAFPQNVTRLAGAFFIDIRSTTKAICERRFCVKMFRMLWKMDSTRNADPSDSIEVVDLDFNEGFWSFSGFSVAVFSVGVAAGEGNGGILHSGRVMIPVTPSKTIGRSTPLIA